MVSVRYHVVVAFGIGHDGALQAVVERAAVDANDASRLAHQLAKDHAGAVAFSRPMEVSRAYYGPATIHTVCGEVPKEVLGLTPPPSKVLRPANQILDSRPMGLLPSSFARSKLRVVKPLR